MEYPVTIKLKHPIHLGTEVVEQLTFRRGCARDAKGIRIGDLAALTMDDILVVAGRMSGQLAGVVEKLDMDDLAEVVAIAMDFISRSLTIGATPSPS